MNITIDWLTDILATGPVPLKTIKIRMGEINISKPTLYRARNVLGVISQDGAEGPVWQLPKPAVPSYQSQGGPGLETVTGVV